MAPTESTVQEAAATVAESAHLVVFTGAGVSTESGIPDFRSPGGVWDRFDPQHFTIQALRQDPVAYWEHRLEMEESREFDWADVDPNSAHTAIARLARLGSLSCVITQNVDGLHQAAGNDPADVLELHGNRSATKCISCDERFPLSVLENKLATDPLPPRCDACDGLLKYATVSFGESLPQSVLSRARREAMASDCFLVVGSSVTVEPAASLPRIAKTNGSSLLVVNLDSTGIDSRADIVIHGKAGEVLPELVEEITG